MSYLAFMAIGLLIAVVIAVALAGPFSALAIIGFWVAHYFFLEWRHKRAPLESMSNFELSDVLNWWIGRGPFGRNTPDISRVRWKGTNEELIAALKRIICIYDEKIRRAKTIGLNTDDYEYKRKQFADELSRASKEGD